MSNLDCWHCGGTCPPGCCDYEARTREAGQAHRIHVAHKRAWNEYAPECSCGWVGSYTPSHLSADRQGVQHATEATR